jgi:DNA-binding transcriptional LysR family regulator
MYFIRAMNIAALDLNLLVAFEALLIEKNVSRAANRIGLSQPGMSNTLARLRNVFDDRLFTRGTNGLIPTAKAVALAAPVREALDLIRNAISERSNFEVARAENKFRVLAPDYCEMAVLAPLVRVLRRTAPRVSLQVARPASLFNLPIDELASDSVDIAIGFFSDVLPPGSGIAQASLGTERLVALADPNRFKQSSLTLKRFLAASQVKIIVGGENRPGLVDEILAKHGYKRHSQLLCSGFLAVPWFISGTDLMGIVPERLATAVAHKLRLRIHKLPIDLPFLQLSAIWHERNTAHPAHRWFRQQLRESSMRK